MSVYTGARMRLPISYRPFNSGGKGGQHSTRTLNAMEVSVTLPDGRRIVAASSSHKSQWRNKARAEKVLACRVRLALEPATERRTAGEVVRTYSMADDRVTDHASGEKRRYRDVVAARRATAFGELVEARRRAKTVEAATA